MRQAGRVQLVTAVIKFVPLLLIGVVGLFFIDADNFEPFTTQEGFDWGINAAALLTLWAFTGLESATVPADEVKEPERTIPRATIIGTAAAAAVYLLSSLALFGMIPSATLAESTSPFADGANAIFGGTWGGEAIAIVAMVSIVGALNGWILLQGRVPLAAAQDGLFPGRFATVESKRGTPAFGIVVSSLFATALLALNFRDQGGVVDLFTEIITIATLAALIPYAFSAAAEIYLAIVDRESFSGVNLARSSIIALLALAYSSWAIWGAGYKPVTEGFMMLLAGIPIFLWVTWRGRSGEPRGSGVAARPSILSP